VPFQGLLPAEEIKSFVNCSRLNHKNASTSPPPTWTQNAGRHITFSPPVFFAQTLSPLTHNWMRHEFEGGRASLLSPRSRPNLSGSWSNYKEQIRQTPHVTSDECELTDKCSEVGKLSFGDPFWQNIPRGGHLRPQTGVL